MKNIAGKVTFILGVALLLLFIFTLDMGTFKSALNASSVEIIITVIGLTLVNITIKALRWKIFVKKIAKKDLSIPFSIASILAGVATSTIFPGKLEFAKPLLLKSEKKIAISKTIPAIIMEKILDFVALAFLLLASLGSVALQKQEIWQLIFPILIFFVIFSLIGLLFYYIFIIKNKAASLLMVLPFLTKYKKKIIRFFELFREGFKLLRQKKLLYISSILTIAANITEIWILYLVLQQLNVPISFSLTTLIFTASVFISIISMIPGGIGITEFSLTGLLTTLLQNSALAPIQAATLISRLFSYYFVVLLGLAVLLFLSRFRRYLAAAKMHKIFKAKSSK